MEEGNENEQIDVVTFPLQGCKVFLTGYVTMKNSPKEDVLTYGGELTDKMDEVTVIIASSSSKSDVIFVKLLEQTLKKEELTVVLPALIKQLQNANLTTALVKKHLYFPNSHIGTRLLEKIDMFNSSMKRGAPQSTANRKKLKVEEASEAESTLPSSDTTANTTTSTTNDTTVAEAMETLPTSNVTANTTPTTAISITTPTSDTRENKAEEPEISLKSLGIGKQVEQLAVQDTSSDTYIKSAIIDATDHSLNLLPFFQDNSSALDQIRDTIVQRKAEFSTYQNDMRNSFIWKMFETKLKDISKRELFVETLRNILSNRVYESNNYSYDEHYIYNWIDKCFVLSENRIFDQVQLEVWWDIHLWGCGVDSCFYPLFEYFKFHRREKRVEASHHISSKQNYKVDMLVQFKTEPYFEIAALEGCLPNDPAHFREDRLKLAKLLKNFLDKVAQSLFYPHNMFRFIGLQTQGRDIKIHEVTRDFQEVYIFHTLASFSIPNVLERYEQLEECFKFAFAMLKLKSIFNKCVSNVKNLHNNPKAKVSTPITLPTFHTPVKPSSKSNQKPSSTNDSQNKPKSNSQNKGNSRNYTVNLYSWNEKTENSDIKVATNLLNNSNCVLKYCKNAIMGENELRSLKYLNNFECCYYTTLLDHFYSNGYQVLVFPLYKKLNIDTFSMKQVQQLMYHLLTALGEIHSHGYIHYDVKLDNIVYDANKNCYVLIDFGLALPISTITPYPPCGTKGYKAPEVINNEAIGTAADVWSAGIVLGELVQLAMNEKSRHFGWPDLSYRDLQCMTMDLVEKCNSRSSISQKAVNLLTKMLDTNQFTRITVQKALTHEFFEDNC